MERIDIDGPDVDFDESQLLLYRGEYFTGEAVEYFPDGRLWTLKTFVNGFENGPTGQWFNDGGLQSEGVAKRNSAVGEWRSWFPGGRLERVSIFDDDGNLLTRTDWNEDGEIVKQSPPPLPDYGSGAEQ